MTIKELLEWKKLSNQKEIDKPDYQELIRLNHRVMEIANEIHNNNMLIRK